MLGTEYDEAGYEYGTFLLFPTRRLVSHFIRRVNASRARRRRLRCQVLRRRSDRSENREGRTVIRVRQFYLTDRRSRRCVKRRHRRVAGILTSI